MIHHCYDKKAFTLAEVLITLGVIGIVAALTLPTLIGKYQEKQWVTGFLRIYSMLDNAYRMAQIENGTYENWGAGVTYKYDTNGHMSGRSGADYVAVYNTMIKPYFNINQAWEKSGRKNCMPEKSYTLDGKEYTSNFDSSVSSATPAVSLVSGECILISSAAHGGEFFVDINSKKGPNTLGKDQFLFSFDLFTPTRIKPGYIEPWWTDRASYCDFRDAHGWQAGLSCGFWIARNKNMDYLHMSYEELQDAWGKQIMQSYGPYYGW